MQLVKNIKEKQFLHSENRDSTRINLQNINKLYIQLRYTNSFLPNINLNSSFLTNNWVNLKDM